MFAPAAEKEFLHEKKYNHLRNSVALIVSLTIIISLIFLPVYPCGYYDANDSEFAGHGHHSLYTVVKNWFGWDSDSVPDPYEKYHGDGPYVVKASAWLIGLYVIIFMGIFYLGWLMANNFDKVINRLKNKS